MRKHAATERPGSSPRLRAIEAEIADLDDDEKQIFLADLGLDEPGLTV